MNAGLIVGGVIGGLIGYGWYRAVGCSSGACPITSSPWISTIVGVMIGLAASGGV
ncbi:MAG: YtxH domain-containing protein [bacterium]